MSALSTLRRTLLAAAAVSLCGCTLVPKQKPTAGPLPQQWTEAAEKPDAAAPGDWWNAFADPTLKTLTTEGLRDSVSVRQAVLRVTKARADTVKDIAQYLPSFSADARGQFTRVLKGPPLVGSFTSFVTGGTTTGIVRENQQAFGQIGPSVSWEVPLFGLIPLSAKGAKLTRSIAAEDLRGATVALVGDIADAYIDLRAAQNRKIILGQSLDVSERLAEMLESTVASGYTSQADAADARRQAATTRARLPDADISYYIAKSTLAVLRGKAPGTEDAATEAALDAVAPVPTFPFGAPPSAPSDLLRLRPDVAAAERQAILSAVATGAARHQLLPKLTITGNVGLADNLIGSPLPEQQGQLQITPLVTVPLFDFGSKLAQAKSQKTQFRVDLLTYRDTVNKAVQEADRALVELRNAKERLDATATAEKSAELLAAGARAAQEAGIRSLRDRLQSEQLLLEAKLSRVEAEASLAHASAKVYRAFAGALGPDGPVSATAKKKTKVATAQ